jgi:AraC-like DNA-binding protein
VASDAPFISDLERAARAVETVCGLRVCIHDLCGRLGVEFPPSRAWHGGPICAAVKLSTHFQRCHDFEVGQLRPQLGRWREGRIQRCHAGLIEWMVPVFDREDHPLAVVFAGQRRASGWAPDVIQPLSGAKPGSGAAAVDEPTARAYLEVLRHFALRLAAWLERSADARPVAVSWAARIHAFLDLHHHEEPSLARLASALGLAAASISRTVKAETGRSWRDLLSEYRLRTACRLLAQSDLSVGDVAMRSGFGDQSHFQRLFRERLGETPRRWRLKHGAPS